MKSPVLNTAKIGASLHLVRIGTPGDGGFCDLMGMTHSQVMTMLEELRIPLFSRPDGQYFNLFSFEKVLFLLTDFAGPGYATPGSDPLYRDLALEKITEADLNQLLHPSYNVMLTLAIAASLYVTMSAEELQRRVSSLARDFMGEIKNRRREEHLKSLEK